MSAEMRSFLHRFDWVLAGAAFLLFLIGLSTIYSTILAGQGLSETLVYKQLLAFILGIFLAWFLIKVDLRSVRFFSPFLFGGLLVLLVLVVLTADPIRGASSWFVIGGFQFQPSEFIKVALILVLASYCGHFGRRMKQWKVLFGYMLILALPLALILMQPDFGTAVVVMIIGATIVCLSSTDLKKLLLFILIGVIFVPVGYNSLADYQKARISSFLDPSSDPLGAGYNQIQSVIAVGSGNMLGRGWGRGTQSHLRFLPEQHTDFIFATFTEEFGFVGGIIVLFLIAIIVVRLMYLARRVQDRFSFYIIIGILSYLSIQSIANIGMNIGLFPVTGLPLPLMSYGGSSLITTIIAIALAEAVAVQRTN